MIKNDHLSKGEGKKFIDILLKMIYINLENNTHKGNEKMTDTTVNTLTDDEITKSTSYADHIQSAKAWQSQGIIVMPNQFPLMAHSTYSQEWLKTAKPAQLRQLHAAYNQYAHSEEESAKEDKKRSKEGETESSNGYTTMVVAGVGNMTLAGLKKIANVNHPSIDWGLGIGLTLILTGMTHIYFGGKKQKEFAHNAERHNTNAYIAEGNVNVIRQKIQANEPDNRDSIKLPAPIAN